MPLPTPPPPSPTPPPAIVQGCSTVRHDGARQATAAAVGSLLGEVGPYGGYGLGGAAAQSAGDATVWSELQAELQNTGALTIVGVRLGVKTGEGSLRLLDVPITIAPNGDATLKERLATGPVQVGDASCTLLRVNFSDGTSWYAPPAAQP